MPHVAAYRLFFLSFLLLLTGAEVECVCNARRLKHSVCFSVGALRRYLGPVPFGLTFMLPFFLLRCRVLSSLLLFGSSRLTSFSRCAIWLGLCVSVRFGSAYHLLAKCCRDPLHSTFILPVLFVLSRRRFLPMSALSRAVGVFWGGFYFFNQEELFFF